MKLLYEDGTWEIREEEESLPDGRVTTTTRARRCDGIHVIAFLDASTVLLLREYRPFWKEWCWLIPSGDADKEADVVGAAQRGLQEETGYRAAILTHWFSTDHAEVFDTRNHVFLARGLEKAPLQQDAHELIEVHPMPIEDAVGLARGGKIRHTVSAYALLRYALEKPSF